MCEPVETPVERAVGLAAMFESYTLRLNTEGSEERIVRYSTSGEKQGCGWRERARSSWSTVLYK